MDAVSSVAPAIVYHLERFKRKLATGVYQMEPVACFCGETNGQPIRTVDRYGLPHRMCFCQRCGVLYASPRMTAKTLAQFYADDYRKIYDAGLTPERAAEQAAGRVEAGQSLYETCTDFGLIPRTVFELGCHDGGMLDAFAESGATCLGVDHDPQTVACGQAKGRSIVVGGLDVLEQYGHRADLIILHHVLEHLPDLEQTLLRLHALLAPTGFLYVALPTLYCEPMERLWQNAHLYQFTARTLEYVMGCCGFDDVWMTEDILSLWRPVTERTAKTEVNSQEVYRIATRLNSGITVMPMVKTVNKFPRPQRIEQIAHAAQAGWPNLHRLIDTHPDSAAIIIGGGPSIDGEVERIRALRAEGHQLYAIERMLPWCVAHALMPDYVVVMDAHENVQDSLWHAPVEPTYLVALQCHHSVFTRLNGLRAYTFATPQKDLSQAEVMDRLKIEQWTLVNAGGSVVQCAMNLALILGARRIHLFGFDCQVTDRLYANGIAGAGGDDALIEIEVAGYQPRIFTTTLPYLAFAQDFIRSVELFRRQGYLEHVTLYGESLVRYLAQPGPKLTVEPMDEGRCLLK